MSASSINLVPSIGTNDNSFVVDNSITPAAATREDEIDSNSVEVSKSNLNNNLSVNETRKSRARYRYTRSTSTGYIDLTLDDEINNNNNNNNTFNNCDDIFSDSNQLISRGMSTEESLQSFAAIFGNL